VPKVAERSRRQKTAAFDTIAHNILITLSEPLPLCCCECGQQQKMSHIVDACPLTKFDGGLQLLYEAEDDTVKWLEATATTAFAK